MGKTAQRGFHCALLRRARHNGKAALARTGALTDRTMAPVYFDLTDIIHFLEKNHRVSGIARVQLRLISSLVRSHGTSCIKGVALFDGRNDWRTIELDFLTEQTELDATQFLMQAGKLTPSRCPPKNQVKKYLAPYAGNKPLRALKKAALHLHALLAPGHLEKRLGARFHTAPANIKQPEPFSALPVDSMLAILGNSWETPHTADLCIGHRQHGGRVSHMIHDIIPFMQPELHGEGVTGPFNRWLEKTPRYVDTYICVSHNTAEDVRAFLKDRTHSALIKVAPLAHEFPGYPRHDTSMLGSAVLPQELLGKEYVLCVGSLEIRKNGAALLRAWQKVHQTLGSSTPLLVFAGKRAWSLGEFNKALAEKTDAASYVHILESPSDAQLAALYQGCLFTAYPSLYEGWGLPVGESAWFDKYGVVSQASSVPEVCGPLMDYVDPRDIADIATKMLKPLLDRDYLARKNAAVRASTLRTWDEVADNVYALLTAARTQV